ncbi:LytTR family DNA-binding domain-containing protein [Pseudogracilibacillus auburnensis]|uniref:LytTR family DNA-binding domain-containing protein n=1 Tax=Pseudogracilibacillus auburnensis TaxID=1494959 RepID=UPI001A968E5C|nr:LytTR family DNA-binding domain-containing protein [Pseudogracilibacillus auburnensis]MBO1002873.1 LytTR family transcriptional regulator DNA-binding domain-containing protein [Pseudogracilibacillus auburnensis]
MDSSIVQHLFNNFYQLFPNTSSIAIADLDKFIYYKPSLDIDLKIKPGDTIHSETVTYKAITTKKRVKEYKGDTIFGVSYYAISQPIMMQKKIVGAMTAIFPREPRGLSIPYLTVRTSDRWVPIHFENIIFMEAQNRKTNVTSENRNGTHRYNLTELEIILPNNIFIRCHRSYIINLHQIREVHPDSHSTFILIMSDQSRVPVSQSYSKQLRNILGF